MTSKPQSRTVNFGDSVQFSCQVSAYPSLTDRVVWYKDGRPVDSSLSTNLSSFGGIMQSSTLTVNDVSEMDCGVYKCYNSSANLFGKPLFCCLLIKLLVSLYVASESQTIYALEDGSASRTIPRFHPRARR